MTGPLSPYRLTGIAAPMTVWALHFVVVCSLQGVTCAEGLDRVRFAGAEALTWWLSGLAVAALAALCWLGLRAWRGWRDAQPGSDVPAHAARRRFAAATTGALSVMAIVAVCFTTIPVLLLPGCA